MNQKLRDLGDEFCQRLFSILAYISRIPVLTARLWDVARSCPPHSILRAFSTHLGRVWCCSFCAFHIARCYKDTQEQNAAGFCFVRSGGELSGSQSPAAPLSQPGAVPPGAAVRQSCGETDVRRTHGSWLMQRRRQRKLQPAPCDLTEPL